MKNIKFIQVFLLLVGVLFAFSCSEEQDLTSDSTRLFRPVLNAPLGVKDNTITVDMAKMKSAVSYKIEVSRDKFVTVLKTIESTDSKVVIADLLWNTAYQVRAIANASTPDMNSKISDLGSATTDKFPTILQNPLPSDLIDISAKVRWQTGVGTGAAITQVKVFALADEELKTPLATFAVNATEQAAGEKIVTGLTAATTYQIAIYSGTQVRGWGNYTTNASLVFSGDVYDLRGIVDNPAILIQTLKNATNGSTILLDPTVVYTTVDGTGSFSFKNSVTIKSGYSLSSQGGATLNMTNAFNLVAGSNIASIVFDGLTLGGDFNASYAFNINTSGTIGEIKFTNCNVSNLRGFIRAQGTGTGTITKVTVNNCVIHDIKDYGVLNMDSATWKFNDAVITGSTIYKTQKFLVSKSNSNSVLIQDCTINEACSNGSQLFIWSTNGSNNVTNGFTIQNTIIGRAWNPTGTDYTFKGMTGLATTVFTVQNSYSTADFKYPATGFTAIPNFPNLPYAKLVTDLWKDSANGDFNILDGTFTGRSNAGDPRWRK